MATTELSDIKASLDALHELVNGMKTSSEDKDKKIDKLIDQVSSLEKLVTKKDKIIAELEKKVLVLEEEQNEMKRYSLKNNIIIKGLPLSKPPRTYAEAATTEQAEDESRNPEPVESKRSPQSAVKMFISTRKQVVEFINSEMGVEVTEDDINAAHELKQGPRDKVAPLVVRFAHTAAKQDVMAARRKLKNVTRNVGTVESRIFFNDQLTRINSELFRESRSLWHQKDIAGTWTTLGKVFAKKYDASRPIWIKSLRDLQQFK